MTKSMRMSYRRFDAYLWPIYKAIPPAGWIDTPRIAQRVGITRENLCYYLRRLEQAFVCRRLARPKGSNDPDLWQRIASYRFDELRAAIGAPPPKPEPPPMGQWSERRIAAAQARAIEQDGKHYMTDEEANRRIDVLWQLGFVREGRHWGGKYV